ncbi:hypothetical protein AC249_AIPGENE26670 [Exaiptasia diaphana]|nr:hypothetical protein AC249_AIPGENE26670 [Exaiptasia diaphana]
MKVSIWCLAILFIHLSDGRSPPLPVQKCTKITHLQCKNAGYPNTAPFPDIQGKPYQEVKGKELNIYLGGLSSCAKTSSAAVLCSLYFPKCVEHLSRPVLPCRSVCNDFVHKCSKELHLVAMQGMLSAMCDLLPIYDSNNPDTCFVPEGFRVNQAHSGMNKTQCHKVGISNCQDDLHYNTTFVATETQNKSNVHLLQSVIATKCSLNIEKFTCFTRFPPCSEGLVQIPCKSTCVEINNSCKSSFQQYNIPVTDCDFLYPDKQGKNGICTLSKWPAPWSAGVQPTPIPPVCNKCNKISIKECANVGYSHTFHFNDINKVPYQNHTAAALEKFLKLLTCSKYAQTILCSLYLPKCDLKTCSSKPVLPCRRVCYEFVRSCDKYLALAAIHGLMIGLCDLLPWNNTAASPCFLPKGFKPTAQVYQRQVCYPVVSNDDQCHKDFSYNATFINPKDPNIPKSHLLQPVIASNCSAKAEKFFCYTRFPPCRDESHLTVPLPCRSMCKEVLGKCKDVFNKYGLPMADCNFLLPDLEGEDGICQADAFPVPFRHFKHSEIHHIHLPGDKKVNGGLIAGMVVLLIVVIVAVAIGVMYYRRKKFVEPFQPKELHNTEGKNQGNVSTA